MLNIHCFNVGHGDCLVIEYLGSEGNAYAVIDSNLEKGQSHSKAYHYLKQKKVKKISFILLTHPHADHFSGLCDILSDFDVDCFYSYPLGYESLSSERKKKFKASYEKYLYSKSEHVRKNAVELIKLFSTIQSSNIKFVELSGPHNNLYPKDFEGVDFECLLPLRLHKGKTLEMIEAEDDSLPVFKDWNKLSVVISLKYKGNRLTFCADSDSYSWTKQKQFTQNRMFIDSNFIKISHHGSSPDNTEAVLKYLSGENSSKVSDRVAVISAPGSANHPGSETLKNLESLQIEPYCTNLSTYCAGDLINLEMDESLTRDLAIFIKQSSNDLVPCQGDVVYGINSNGQWKISTELDSFCPYRQNLF